VIEFGCGDGAQLALAEYPRYIGLDVSPDAIQRCARRFAADPTKSFFRYDPACFVDRAGVFRADLALSLDVIYHLTEEAVFDLYMQHLFASAGRVVVIYSNDSDRPSAAAHIRFHKFSDWIARRASGWSLVRHIPNRFLTPATTARDRSDSPPLPRTLGRGDATGRVISPMWGDSLVRAPRFELPALRRRRRRSGRRRRWSHIRAEWTASSAGSGFAVTAAARALAHRSRSSLGVRLASLPEIGYEPAAGADCSRVLFGMADGRCV
jgi:hypothetical protein